MLPRITKPSLSNTTRTPFCFAFHNPLTSASYDRTLDNNNNDNFFNGDQDDDPFYVDLPRPPRNKSERKPYPTPIKILIERAKAEREARKLQPCRLLLNPPDNGLLVPHLVPVAHHVYHSRLILLTGLSRLVKVVSVLRCRYENFDENQLENFVELMDSLLDSPPSKIELDSLSDKSLEDKLH